MNDELIARAFNEWMRRYIDEPEAFAREFEIVGQFLGEQLNGGLPSYGATCAAYLAQLCAELA